MRFKCIKRLGWGLLLYRTTTQNKEFEWQNVTTSIILNSSMCKGSTVTNRETEGWNTTAIIVRSEGVGWLHCNHQNWPVGLWITQSCNRQVYHFWYRWCFLFEHSGYPKLAVPECQCPVAHLPLQLVGLRQTAWEPWWSSLLMFLQMPPKWRDIEIVTWSRNQWKSLNLNAPPTVLPAKPSIRSSRDKTTHRTPTLPNSSHVLQQEWQASVNSSSQLARTEEDLFQKVSDGKVMFGVVIKGQQPFELVAKLRPSCWDFLLWWCRYTEILLLFL